METETRPANSPSQPSNVNDARESSGIAEFSWDAYKLHIDLYKFYLDLALKANVFFYLLTGGIITYHFQKPKIGKVEMLSLLLPIMIGGVLGWIFIFGARKWNRVVKIIKGVNKTNDEVTIIDSPGEGTETIDAHDVQVLYILLLLFGFIFFLVSIALIIILILELRGLRS